MRPIQLTMQAFGSYGKKTSISFTEPNQNLFLITGNTGAGKTTIFDAIVFALYGEASSGSNKKDGVELQSQFVDYDTEPFVELTFSEAVGGVDLLYTVLRVPRHIRKLKRVAGVMDVKETVSLTMPDGSEYSQNQKETDSRLEEIVGLTKSQFMQIAMIAQGEFMELLRADSNKKKEIFRKLFKTGLFQNIVDELGRRRKDKLSEIAQIRTICQTEAERVVVPETYENAETLLELKRRIRASDHLNVAEMEALLAELRVVCEKLKTQRDSAKAASDESARLRDVKRDAYNSAKILLGSFEQLEKAQADLAACDAAEAEIQEAAKRIASINAAYEIKAVYQRFADADKAAADTESKLTAQRNALPGLTNTYAAAEKKEQAAKLVQNAELETFTKVSERVARALAVFKRIRAAEIDVRIKNAAFMTADEAAETARNALSAFETQEQQWRRQANELANAKELLTVWTAKNKEADGIAADIVSAGIQRDDLESQSEKAERAQQDYADARKTFAERNAEHVAKQNAFLDAQAGFIAKEKLRPGEPCPVCGSKEHPRPCEVSQEHQGLNREAIETLAKEVEELQKDQSSKSAAAGSASELLTEKQRTFAETMTKLRKRLADSIAGTPEEFTLQQAEGLLSEWKAQLEKEGAALAENANTLDRVQKSLQGAEDRKLALKTAAETAVQQASDAKTAFATSQEVLKGLEEQKDYPTEDAARDAIYQATATRAAADTAYEAAHKTAQAAKTAKENSETLIRRYSEELPAQTDEREGRRTAYESILAEKDFAESEWKAVTDQHAKTETADLQESIDAHKAKRASAEGACATAKKAIGDQQKPAMEELEAAKQEAEDKLEAAQSAFEKLKEYHRINTDAYLALSLQMEERGRITQEYTRIDSLYNRLAGKVTGARMDIETFVQRYHLQRILYAANSRFQDLSAGQFELRMVGEERAGEGKNRGLDLMVYSTVTGKEREVRTLSGGESFMAALSLALGMADQIQTCSASVNLDMMFIDEGFGALDDHSRAQAVKVLQQMASGSKLIGIISHVTELSRRSKTS